MRLVFVSRYVLQYDMLMFLSKITFRVSCIKTETGPSQLQKTAPSLILTPHATSCLVYTFYSLE
jgi:hypothetical protein